MGYYMVRWGAGVHQWQITLDQLFRQLYVSSNVSERRNDLICSPVGKYCAGHILSAQLRGQDGYSAPVCSTVRTKSQFESDHVVWFMLDNGRNVHRVYDIHVLDFVLLLTETNDLVQTCTGRQMPRCERYHPCSGCVQHGF
jgi:hypothetical protein